MRVRFFQALAVGGFALLVGCDALTPNSSWPHELWIGDTGILLQPGESFTFSALMQERGSTATRPGSAHVPPDEARWWTDHPGVLDLPDSSEGVVRALAPGRAVIWVEVGARRDSATVTVAADGDHAPSHRWKHVSTWMTTTCALDLEGTAYCWGTNAFGELGNGPRRFQTRTHRPVRVDSPVPFEELEVGTTLACGRTGGGEVWCWGVNHSAQLGHDRPGVDFEEEPVRVAFDGQARQIAVGSQHACLLDEEGRAHCWGSNLGYQLGIGQSVASSAHLGDRTVPVAFDGAFDRLAAAAFNTCGITPAQELYCWGLVSGGAPGVGREAPVPVRIETGAAVPVKVSPGDGGSCYLDAEGQPYCWGIHRLGMTGTTDLSVRVEVGQRFSDLAGPCGVDVQGRAWCWGMAGLFDPAKATEPCGSPSIAMCSTEPVSVSEELRFRAIRVGIAVCGITTDDELYCWGSNEFGQLGTGRPHLGATHVPQRVLDPA